MIQRAEVKKRLDARTALVEVRRPSACGHTCASCGGLCAEHARLETAALNPLGAEPGDAVSVESESRRVLGLAFVTYLGPVLLFFAGLIVAELCAWPRPALWGGVGFALGLFLVWALGRRLKRRGGVTVRIVAVLESRSGGSGE